MKKVIDYEDLKFEIKPKECNISKNDNLNELVEFLSKLRNDLDKLISDVEELKEQQFKSSEKLAKSIFNFNRINNIKKK